MTIKELVEKLNELDPELHVFVPGYEGGYHYANVSKPDSFCLNVNSEWYYGPHESISHIHEEERPDYKIVKGIVL
jgi:hypothetical protein